MGRSKLLTEDAAGRSDFVYDGKMRRRERIEYTWNVSAWVTNTSVFYVYDRNVVLQERNANNLPAVTYTRGGDLSAGQAGLSGTLQGAGGIGGLLARTDNSVLDTLASYAHAYYHADGNGNVTCMINTSNSVVARYLYDPYGRVLSQSGLLAAANLYRFSSEEAHLNSGLVYYLYRFYDPNLQRWVNRDPLEESFDWDLYRYVYNCPVDYFDSDGQGPTGTGIGAGIGGIIGGTFGGIIEAAGGTLALPGGGTVVGAGGLGAIGFGAGAGLGGAAGNAIENIWNLLHGFHPPGGGGTVANQGKGERNWEPNDPDPWKGYHPNDPCDPSKGGWKYDQNGKKKPVRRPPGPPPPNHPNW